MAAENETIQSRGDGWEESIWCCKKGGIKQSSMEDGAASHLRDRPLIIHGDLSTPIEGENHYCEPESHMYASSFSDFHFSSQSQIVAFVPCAFGDIMSNYGQILRIQLWNQWAVQILLSCTYGAVICVLSNECNQQGTLLVTHYWWKHG